MSEPARHTEVVVVGASVAGLAVARRLAGAGVSVQVLEAEQQVGGGARAEEADGFRLDRWARPLSTAWPELREEPALLTVPLREFAPGVLVHSEGRLYRAGEPAGARSTRGARGAKGARGAISALNAARALASAPRTAGPGGRTAVPGNRTAGAGGRGAGRAAPLGGPLDQARLGHALTRLAAQSEQRLAARPESTAARTLTTRGLPARTVDGFLRPLLTALLCDPELSSSSFAADLALHTYARGRLCLPEGGSDAIPAALAAALPPGTVRTGVRVTSVATTSVTTAGHGTLGCRAVVLATGARDAATLLPGLRVPAFRPVTLVHHSTAEPPATQGALVLDAERGPLAWTAVVSQVDPLRAPAGRALVTSALPGPPPADPDGALRARLARVYGTDTRRWELVAVHHDAEAVPALPVPHDPRRPVRVVAGLYVCGGHRDSGDLGGALRSARRAATALLTDLRHAPATGPDDTTNAA
ncbi:FAD-dependent oxidoreductase [Streptomyces sp. NPDC058045]|uniref:FAD-dependent oxidoreductase n=1 Tax=Streptomyces sp. NPDC058045 TaxID=3346311 RepID=UPI0036E68B76